jgi:exosortase E/protease (VPEID-CTERM system)
MVIALISEVEVLVSPNYTIRTALRDAMHLPLYHMVLGFLAVAVLVRALARDRLPPPPCPQLSVALLFLHLSQFALIGVFLRPFWVWTTALSPGLSAFIWLSIMLIFCLTWMAVLLPVSQWAGTLQRHGLWLTISFLVGWMGIGLAQASTWLYKPLAGATFAVAVQMLRPWFSDVVADPAELTMGTTFFSVHIAPGCSGYEGIGLITLFVIAFLFIRRNELRFPAAWTLLPLGILIIWFANAARLAILVALGTLISTEVAMRGFHSQAGWLAFTVIGIGLVLAVEKLGWFRKQQKTDKLHYPAAGYLVPLLVLLFSQMLSRAFSVGFDVYYPFRILAVSCALLVFWRTCRALLPRPSAWSVSVGLGVYVLWALMVPGTTAQSVDEALVPPFNHLWLFFRVFGSVVIIPLTEELAFRGYLLRRLQSVRFESIPIGALTPVSVIASSLAFGILHGEFLAGTMAGLAYAWVTSRRGHLSDAVIAHGITNLCIVIQVLALDQWSLWS